MRRFIGCFALVLASCSSSHHAQSGAGSPDGSAGGAGGIGSATGGTAGGAVATSGGAAGTSNGDGGGTPTTFPDGGGPVTVGPSDAVFPKAPKLPTLTNLTGILREDSVAMDFDPVEGAKDYRIFPLPKDGDVSVDSGGLVVVQGATYRCAGARQGWDETNNLNKDDTTLAVPQGQYSFKTEIPANPTLGYVYVTPGADRTPVYALAGHVGPPEYGWRETRLKVYTTDETDRKTLIDQNWRDDGVVFYVPSAGAGTAKIYASQVTNNNHYEQYYFGEGDVAAHAKDAVPPKVAFSVLTAEGADTQPLMAVTYKAAQTHTELLPGKERFQRAAYQGNSPMWHVEWSGITEPTILVVEALSSGCPFQGLFSATHLDASAVSGENPHQAFVTLDDMHQGSSTGEAFVNGQYDTKTNPKAIARSFIKVAPRPHVASDWDWYQGFTVGTDLGALQEQKTPNTCWMCATWQSPLFDIRAYNIDSPGDKRALTFGTALGQLWLDFDDWKQDVTGKVRFTATEKATMDTDPAKYLHTTMSVDIVSTDRRYPQLIISDQDAPVQEGFANPNNNSLLVQSIGGPASRIEAQAIHGLYGAGGATPSPWDVNNQFPAHVFLDFDAYDGDDSRRPPALPAFEHSGVDRMTKFDVYASSSQVYVFVDDTPAGCTKYPANFALKGAVTVTVGAVLYHEGATDELVWAQPKPYGFWHLHEATETKRHFDDLAFKNGVSAPPWDEKKFPCGAY
jgi:hypothetical protein